MSCSSQLSSVVFVSTLDFYPPNQDIICKFTVKDEELNCYDETCWIAIFRVGWESLNDFVVKKCLPTKGETESGVVLFSNSTEEIIFDASEIPPESNDEFYQFCFISGKGAVLGASCPFQISQASKIEASLSSSLLDLSANGDQKKDEASDLEWCPWFEVSGEDVDDTVFVHNKTTLLERSLAKVIEENNNLRETVELKEADIQKLSTELIDAQNQVTVTRDLLDDKRKQQDSDIQQLDDLQFALEAAKEKEMSLLRQVLEMNKVIANLNKKLEDLKEEIESLTEQLNAKELSHEEKCCKFETRIKESEEMIAELGDTLQAEKKIVNDLRLEHQEELETLTRSFNSVLSELATQNDCVEKLRCEKQALTERLEHTHLSRDEEIKDLADTIARKEQIIKESERKIEELQLVNQEIVMKLQEKVKITEEEIAKHKNDALGVEADFNKAQLMFTEKEAMLINELQTVKEDSLKTKELAKILEDKVKEMKEENYLLKEKSDGHNGARHALQVAYVHTQRQLAQVKGDRDMLAQQYQSMKQQSMDSESDVDLKKQIDDLKLRLCIGANAYKEKFLECKRLQNEVSRLMRIHAKYSTAADQLNDVTVSGTAAIDKTSIEVDKQAMSGTAQAKSQNEHTSKVKILKKIEVDCERSLFKLTAEIKKLQDENKAKDDVIQRSINDIHTAENEIKSLKEQLDEFQNPEGKFTRFYEQFYSNSREDMPMSESTRSPLQDATSSQKSQTLLQIATAASKSMTLPLQGQAEPKSPTRKQPKSPTVQQGAESRNPMTQRFSEPQSPVTQRFSEPKSPTTQQPAEPRTQTIQRTSELRNSTQQESLAPVTRSPTNEAPNQYKIYLPPESLTKPPTDVCLTSPYMRTLREPVTLTSPYNGVGIDAQMSTAGTYPSESSKQHCTSTTDVFKADPVFACPVCNMIFPSEYSDNAATNHVNSHFPDNPSRAKRR